MMPRSDIAWRFKATAKRWLLPANVPLFWSKTRNWGDALSPYLVERISGLPARFESFPFVRKVLAIGSIVNHADEWSTIWGSGLISPRHLPAVKPDRILAVRGPRTREALVAVGLKCCQVYGDPALLLPRYLPRDRDGIHEVGVVAHHTDRDHPWIRGCREAGHLVLDVESDIEYFAKQVMSCKTILSSSLHGLICADAYGVPSRRILLGSELIGGDFKFEDYLASLQSAPEIPLRPATTDDAVRLSSFCTLKNIDIDLDQLLAVCPFFDN